MKVILFGNGEQIEILEKRVKGSLDDLGLTDFIELELSSDDTLKEEMGIKEIPALIIVEETIDFKDVIFEGMVPEEAEIQSMFVSIIGGGEGGGCSSEGGCGDCSSGCG